MIYKISGSITLMLALLVLSAWKFHTTVSMELDLPPKVRQVVKTQNPLNGRIESWDCLAGSSPRSSSWPR